jgi:hypothetical protein
MSRVLPLLWRAFHGQKCTETTSGTVFAGHLRLAKHNNAALGKLLTKFSVNVNAITSASIREAVRQSTSLLDKAKNTPK